MTSSAENEITINGEPNEKRILNARTYQKLSDFINNYDGLPIDCEMELVEYFSQIHRLTLKSILENELNFRARSDHWHHTGNVGKYYMRYLELCDKNPQDYNIILNMAKELRAGPTMLCRLLIKYKYNLGKGRLSQFMRHPDIIPDSQMSANVTQCLSSDAQNGPLVDLRRRALGEEYEVKLKRKASEAGLQFYDENDLRRLGYDKTPDIKLILPVLYKGEVVNWIESKAYFGDTRLHKINIQQQLTSYCNRFGPGIVIYWFGYHEGTSKLPENSAGITVLDDFPSKIDIQCLQLNGKTNDSKIKKFHNKT